MPGTIAEVQQELGHPPQLGQGHGPAIAHGRTASGARPVPDGSDWPGCRSQALKGACPTTTRGPSPAALGTRPSWPGAPESQVAGTGLLEGPQVFEGVLSARDLTGGGSPVPGA